jgi:hypothetical protein
LGGSKGGMGLTPLSPGGLRVAHPGVQYVEAPRSAEKAKGGNLSPLNLDGSRSTDEHEAKGRGGARRGGGVRKGEEDSDVAPTALFDGGDLKKDGERGGGARRRLGGGEGGSTGDMFGSRGGWKGAKSPTMASPVIANSLCWGADMLGSLGNGSEPGTPSTSQPTIGESRPYALDPAHQNTVSLKDASPEKSHVQRAGY